MGGGGHETQGPGEKKVKKLTGPWVASVLTRGCHKSIQGKVGGGNQHTFLKKKDKGNDTDVFVKGSEGLGKLLRRNAKQRGQNEKNPEK